jgi:hypothetical protein
MFTWNGKNPDARVEADRDASATVARNKELADWRRVSIINQLLRCHLVLSLSHQRWDGGVSSLPCHQSSFKVFLAGGA